MPEPRRDPTQVGCDPHPGAASVARKRVPACRPVVGVAAEVATWSPSSHGTPRGSPEPPEWSISDRLLIAARSPLRAIPRRPPGGALTVGGFMAMSRGRDLFTPRLRFFLSRMECVRVVLATDLSLRFLFQKQAGISPLPSLLTDIICKYICSAKRDCRILACRSDRLSC